MPRASSSHHHARTRAQAVTTAPRSQDEDRVTRMKRYLWAMGIRTACFPLAVWAFASGRYVLAWTAAIGAAVIPSFAVMLANAVDRRQDPAREEPASPVRGLGAGPSAGQPPPGPAQAPAADDDPIQGTIVSRSETAYPRQEQGPRQEQDPAEEGEDP